jgi:alpha-L-rhamnosidase
MLFIMSPCLRAGQVAQSTPSGMTSVRQALAPAVSLTVGAGAVNPVGYHDASPTFSWKLPAGVVKQSAYRLETRANGKSWDSGWVESAQSTHIPYRGAPLGSRDRVSWRVNYRDEAGREAGWSEAATFELGLLSAADWRAKWIRPAGELGPKTEPVAILRREFVVGKPVSTARLYITARGLFQAELNGERVGRDHFANGFTSYTKRIDTLTYDLTRQLKPGN